MDVIGSFIARFASEFWHILAESGFWLLVGLLFAGVMHAIIPAGWITRQLGGKGLGPIAKASLLGIPLPLCSCSVIPVAAGLRREGAGPGATAAFTVSTPQTGEESIPLTWALLGPWFALARPIIAVITAFVAGVAVMLVGRRNVALTQAPPPSCGCAASKPACCSAETPKEPASSCCSTKPKPPSKIAAALRYAFVTLLDDIALWLLIGLSMSALVAALIDPGSLPDHLGGGWIAMLIVLVAGVPLYICATSSTPLVAALIAAGVSPGAGMVLLLAGPATNLATITWLWKDLGGRALAAYLASIAVVAIASGLAVDALLASATTAEAAMLHEHGASALQGVSALLFAGILTFSIGRQLARTIRGPQTPGRAEPSPVPAGGR
ncbi:MAG: SO_0444 family Cu/Zn efflux transporter [Planctomycetota bacterium]